MLSRAKNKQLKSQLERLLVWAVDAKELRKSTELKRWIVKDEFLDPTLCRLELWSLDSGFHISLDFTLKLNHSRLN